MNKELAFVNFQQFMPILNFNENINQTILIHINILKLTLSAILCGSVACPLLARTRGRMVGGCGAAGMVVGKG